MEVSKKLMEQAGILPKLSLFVQLEGGGTKTTGPHIVTLKGEKLRKGKDFQTNQEIDVMDYIVEEKGVEKVYSTPVKNKEGKLSYLVQTMSKYEVEDELVMEGKKKGIRGYVAVKKVGEELSDEEEE